MVWNARGAPGRAPFRLGLHGGDELRLEQLRNFGIERDDVGDDIGELLLERRRCWHGGVHLQHMLLTNRLDELLGLIHGR